MAKKEKYVIRYNIRTWIDITVEAESEDEAYELAEEKYCTGDYEEHPENSETWSTQNVTKEYNDQQVKHMTTIIITECIAPYGKYWIFRNKENGQEVAEVDKKRKSDCGYNGYIIYGGAGCFTEIGRRSGKDAAMEFAKESVRELYLSNVEFKWNPICHRIKLA